MGISVVRDEDEASERGYKYPGFYLDKDNDICHVTKVDVNQYSIVWVRHDRTWTGKDSGIEGGYIDTLRPCPAFTLRYTP